VSVYDDVMAGLEAQIADIDARQGNLSGRVMAAEQKNVLKKYFSNGIFDTSGDGSQYGFKITLNGMYIDVSETGTVTPGNYSEIILEGGYYKREDESAIRRIVAGDPTNDRIDLVYFWKNGLAVKIGIPSSSPVVPNIPAGGLKIGHILVPANETDGTGLVYTDGRIFAKAVTTNDVFEVEHNSDGTHINLQSTTEKNQVNGYAGLEADGKINSALLPAIAISETFTVASEAEQLALTAQEGDVAIRTDESLTYIHNGGSAGTIADWTQLQSPTDAVTSVDGRTGVITLNDLYLGITAKASDSEKLDGYNSSYFEPAFTKNTGFNKSLGTTAGTVSEGNHSHSTIGNALKIQGKDVSTTAPTDGQVLEYDSSASKYVPTTPSSGGGTLDGAIVSLSSDQILTSINYTIVNLDTELQDTNNEFDTTNHKFVASKAGKLRVSVNLNTYSSSSGRVLNFHILQGSTLKGVKTITNSTYFSICNSTIISVSSGDVLYIRLSCDLANCLRIEGNANYTSQVVFEWVA